MFSAAADQEEADILSAVLSQYYLGRQALPREILVPCEPEDMDTFAALALDNRFAPINFAYGAAFLSLLLACALMASHMNLVLVLIVSGLAALLRYTLLNHAARSETFA